MQIGTAASLRIPIDIPSVMRVLARVLYNRVPGESVIFNPTFEPALAAATKAGDLPPRVRSYHKQWWLPNVSYDLTERLSVTNLPLYLQHHNDYLPAELSDDSEGEGGIAASAATPAAAIVAAAASNSSDSDSEEANAQDVIAALEDDEGVLYHHSQDTITKNLTANKPDTTNAASEPSETDSGEANAEDVMAALSESDDLSETDSGEANADDVMAALALSDSDANAGVPFLISNLAFLTSIPRLVIRL